LRISSAESLVSQPAQDADFVAWLAGAVDPWMDRIAGVAPGRLVSLGLDLPRRLLDLDGGGRGDRLWLSPRQGVAFLGGGEVAGHAAMGAAQWRREHGPWARLSDGAPAPLAFFTAPPAPQSGSIRLSLPEILLRRDGGRQSIVLSDFRGEAPVEAVARRWMMRFAAMSAPAAAESGAGVEKAVHLPERDEWGRRVRAATAAIAAGRLAKVVLARKLAVTLRRTPGLDALARKLAQDCPGCRIVKLPHERGQAIAATPEILAARRGSRLVSHAVAGTAPRGGGPEADRRAAQALLASPKERREHRLVVDAIAGAMDEICDDVGFAAAPDLIRLNRLQHLWTPVHGRLREGYDLLDAVERLHPTPAVLGFPKSAAADWLRAAEPPRDGLYTGLAGWIDADGDGEAAVMLRCAFFEGREAHLWAGAGIMAESEVEAEWAETELKMSTMLDLLQGSAS
jgi:menaquinone-specific isochorismate synthase